MLTHSNSSIISLFASAFMTKRLELLRWSSWYSVLSILLIAAFALNFARFMPEFNHWIQSAYVTSALLGHFSSLGLIFYLVVLLPLILLVPQRILIKALLVLIATLAGVAIVLDYQVYTQYRFHLNGVLLNLIIEDGGEEIFVFSWMTWLLAGGVFLGILLTQLLLVRITNKWVLRSKKSKAGVWVGLIFIFSFIVSHSIHIWADAHYDQRITGLTRHIPFYYPTTAKGFLQKRGWANLDKNREQAQQALKMSSGTNKDLDYPKSPLSCQAPEAAKNVLLIVIDTWRYDELDSQTTPFLSALKEEDSSLYFDRHYSGGNSTKSGIFSLFYGLPSNYWSAMSAGLTSPVLMDQFQQADYQMGVFASAKLTHPAFDRNVFAGIPNLRTSSTGDNAWQKDQDVNADWERFLEDRDQSKPFFGFLFYDSPHAYTFPPGGVEPIEPLWERIDHLALNQDFDPTPYLNRHKTSVKYVDQLIQQVVEQLKQQGLYENTVILITADHGEEFNDNGQNFWGHGSNYTDVQTRVPMLIHWPGKPSRPMEHRTSHMDLPTTLLSDVLGCANPAADYSIGKNLFDETPREWLYAGSYYNYAILMEDSILVTYPTGNYELLGLDNRPLDGKTLKPQMSLEILQALSRFYR
ncbi:DUF3413 domain-containing protein [Motiliproteus sp. MSK22-1]|uniref:DUF3413 domain-containing protein n=1 Tax=Motiliproteus sp. MSK22-1 TaxID=1897630 RepID=UPI000978A1E0|nr:DUF3413 domain-containing protein [Motiliproteus sp. MSK22-1]OMH32718.1 hypothetical protein BGP75_14390 [Motiliproteus sp. MSK22-1]